MTKQIKDIREFQSRIAEVEEGSLVPLEGKEYQERMELRNRLLDEEVQELKQALLDRNSVEIIDAAVDTLYILLGTVHEAGLLDKFEKAWDLVHTNNLTKLDENGKVVKNEFGKVIKPANYKPVDLTVLFNENQPVKVIKLELPNCKPCQIMDERLKEKPLSIPLDKHVAYDKPELVEKYNISKFPAFIVVDKDDNSLFIHQSGLITVDKLNKAIDDLRRK